MQYGGCQGHGKVRSRSLTFDELKTFTFLVSLHVFRVLFGADFEFSIQLSIYEVILVP